MVINESFKLVLSYHPENKAGAEAMASILESVVHRLAEVGSSLNVEVDVDDYKIYCHRCSAETSVVDPEPLASMWLQFPYFRKPRKGTR